MKWDLPKSVPLEDVEGREFIYKQIFEEAEKILGPKDNTKLVSPRLIRDSKAPRILSDGVSWYASLNRGAESDWHIFVMELAHEISHLLNPTEEGNGTWLSEGIAVAFSNYIQRKYKQRPLLIKEDSYNYAFELVSKLSPFPLMAGRIIRNLRGSLNAVDEYTIKFLFPNISVQTAAEICSIFNRKWKYPT